MVDSLILSQQDYFTITKATGKAPERAENGGHPVAFPYDAFRTKDDWIAIACWGDYMFPKLASLIGMPQLVDESEFKNEKLRCRNRSACREYIEKWVCQLTTAEALALLDQNGVPAAEIYDYKQVLESEQVQYRKLIQRVVHPIAGEIDVPGVGPKLSETPGKVRTPSPMLGEHNEEILSELLHYSLEQIKEFKKEGVII
jgi:crotonobetainyl-CoA:carnitine CoA-transferase CaiB-like acyl-CoA transferase